MTMNHNPAGIKFEAWLRRPVYKAQCATFAVARMLSGNKHEPGFGHVTQMGDAANGLTLMHALPAYPQGLNLQGGVWEWSISPLGMKAVVAHILSNGIRAARTA
jgi:hypothetical protein